MKLLILLSIIAFLKNVDASIQDKFCGKFNCYDELELTRDATQDELKKQYRKLSRKYHPDVQRHSGITDNQELQQRINAAYETLNDPEIRKSYDFFLDHPEYNQMHHYYNYYKAYFLPKIDPTFVITVFILLISTLQYFGRKTMYERACFLITKTDTFRREVNLRFNDPQNKKSKQEVEKDVGKEVNIEGGWSKPKITDILAIQIVLLPYTLFNYFKRKIRWYIKYTIKKEEFTNEDKYIATQMALKMNDKNWNKMEQEEKDFLVSIELWIKNNLDTYTAEQERIKKEEQQKLFQQSGKYKRYVRYMKYQK